MAKQCNNCGFENKEEALFCASCGAPFAAAAPEVEVVATPKRKRRWGVIIFSVLLVGFVAVVALYFFLGRPFVQDRIIDQFDSMMSDVDLGIEYPGGLGFFPVSEDDFNDAIDEYGLRSDMFSLDGVEFQQDKIVLVLTLFNRVSVDYQFDFRVDSSGNLIVKEVKVPWLSYLIFEKTRFTAWIEDTINEKVLEEVNVKFISLQVTDGEIFYVYDSRD